MYRQNYPAKVLLFGEHTVLRSGQALAVPHPTFGLQWSLKRTTAPDHRLFALLKFLEQTDFEDYLQLSLLRQDLQKGWRLAGNVPYGYGLGSSGVVCAAIWHRYGKTIAAQLDPVALRKQLAKMEGFYHGSSSGTDPLISYLNRPARLSSTSLELIDLPPKWSQGLFLLDTRRPRKSAPLIQYFTNRFDGEANWRKVIQEKWMPASDNCISALIEGNREKLRLVFSELSALQLEEVPGFVPDDIHPIWLGKQHCLKLCGAGGGGFMLGLSNNWAHTCEELKHWKLYPLF